MTITFFTRYTTHHIMPWCQELFKLTNGSFRLVETEAFPKFRLDQGYEDWAKKLDWCINVVTDSAGEAEAIRLAVESDVVIFGGGSYRYQKLRVEKTNKLSFKMKERLYKDGFDKMKDQAVMADMYEKHGQYVSANLYYLCAGTYTAYDVHYQGFEPHRLLKWGYFPPTTIHREDEFVCQSKENYSMLWVGNMERNKQPDMILPVLKSLIEKGYKLHLTYIGSGELLEMLHALVEKLELQSNVNFEPNIPWQMVRQRMFDSDIILCTSNYAEGWGAVISEAMNEGAITVATYASGASCYLIKKGKNGFLFEHENPKELEAILKYILNNYQYMTAVRQNAYKTIIDKWTGKLAAKRLYDTICHLLDNHQNPLFKDGICSVAPLFFDSNDFKQSLQ